MIWDWNHHASLCWISQGGLDCYRCLLFRFVTPEERHQVLCGLKSEQFFFRTLIQVHLLREWLLFCLVLGAMRRLVKEWWRRVHNPSSHALKTSVRWHPSVPMPKCICVCVGGCCRKQTDTPLACRWYSSRKKITFPISAWHRSRGLCGTLSPPPSLFHSPFSHCLAD